MQCRRAPTYSNSSGGDCVEAATTHDGRPALRDSKNPGGPAILFLASQWRTFIHGIKLTSPGN
ncbi:MAG TPA: DUF397 domain-containing protein [Streptosporangiaceae bacterium]